MATVTVHVKHGSSTLQASLAPDAKVTALQEELERQTGVFVRHQKLIHKGKVLEGGQRLTECGVTDGSKLMLMASQGAQTKVGCAAPSHGGDRMRGGAVACQGGKCSLACLTMTVMECHSILQCMWLVAAVRS